MTMPTPARRAEAQANLRGALLLLLLAVLVAIFCRVHAEVLAWLPSLTASQRDHVRVAWFFGNVGWVLGWMLLVLHLWEWINPMPGPNDAAMEQASRGSPQFHELDECPWCGEAPHRGLGDASRPTRDHRPYCGYACSWRHGYHCHLGDEARTDPALRSAWEAELTAQE